MSADELFRAAVKGLVPVPRKVAVLTRQTSATEGLTPEEQATLNLFLGTFPGTEVGQFEPLARDAPSATKSQQAEGLRLTALADIEMRPARFTWEPRIPLGALTLIAGIPGQGKSTLATEIAARITRGQLQGDLFGRPCDVVVASAEDAPSFVLAPRFTAAGADLARAHLVSVHRDDTDLGISIPDDLEALREQMRCTGARLLIIDPLLAHIPARIDGYKDQHVRIALAPLARLAEDLDAAVVGVMHLNKREAADLFSRIGGSGGFLAAARSALLVAPDPEDDTVRVVAHGKANLSPLSGSLKFRLEQRAVPASDPDDGPIHVSGVTWLGETDLDVHSLLGAARKTARGDAMAWLVQLLSSGAMPVEWIKNAAIEAGHAWTTIERAKKDLGVTSARVGGLGGEGRWEWGLP